jgi:catechol 2,3-dioxygenase-like lactoylglutathione lyase family enzyme
MDVPVTLQTAHIRIARPTSDLDGILRFYGDGLGFALLDQFTDHAGFDGVMLGHPGGGYHLEFTRKAGHSVEAPAEDDLLVFYLPDQAAWSRAVERLQRAGYPPVTAANPYWGLHGQTFADPDGHRVVLQNAAWPA